MQEEEQEVAGAAPDPYVARIPEGMLMAVRYLLMVSAQGTWALWRTPHTAVPQLAPLVAELENLTGLTSADIVALSEAANSSPGTAREMILRSGRLYLFMAVGMHVYESPLYDSPLVPPTPAGAALEEVLAQAQALFQLLEATEGGQIGDYPSDYDPLDAPADPDDPTDTPQGTFYSVEELRLRRLQLQSLFEQAAPRLRTVVEIDRARLPADETPDAPDPTDSAHHHEPGLRFAIRPMIRALAATALSTAAYWYLDAAVPFALAASRLRWLRNRAATYALAERFLALTYPEPDDMTAHVPIELSLAEILTLYQAQESVALALLSDDILPAILALYTPTAAARAGESITPPKYARWLSEELDPSSRLGELFLVNVPLFAEILTERLTGSQVAAFADARTEVTALAELATSPGAV